MKHLTALLMVRFLVAACGDTGRVSPGSEPEIPAPTPTSVSPPAGSPSETDETSDSTPPDPTSLAPGEATVDTTQQSEDTSAMAPTTTPPSDPSPLPPGATDSFRFQGDALEAMLSYLADTLAVDKSELQVLSDAWIEGADGAPCGGTAGGGQQPGRLLVGREVILGYGSTTYRLVATGPVVYLCQG